MSRVTNVTKSVDKPHDRMTRIAEEALNTVEALEPAYSAIVIVTSGEHSGVAVRFYDHDEAIEILEETLEAIRKATQ